MAYSQERVELVPVGMQGNKRALSERKLENNTELATLKWYEIKTNDFSQELIKHRYDFEEQERDRKDGDDTDNMSANARQIIMDSQFDFETITGCIHDIRKGFWNVKRANDFYSAKLRATHSHFHNKIVPGREQERQEMKRRLNKGGFIQHLDLLQPYDLKASNKNESIRFDSGSDRDSHQDDKDSALDKLGELDLRSNNSRIDIDRTYQPNLVEKQAKEINKERIRQMDKVSQEIINVENSNESQMVKFNKPMDVSPRKMIQHKNASVLDHQEGNKLKANPSNASQKRRKTFANNSVERASILQTPRENLKFQIIQKYQPSFYEDLTDQQFQSELLSDSDLSRITFTMFEKKMKDESMIEELALHLSRHLMQKFQLSVDFEKLRGTLAFVDKSLFIMLREGKVTLRQLRARIAERRGLPHYKVFDDIYADLSEVQKQRIKNQPDRSEFLFGKNPNAKVYSKELEPYQSDPKCIRSIKYHHKISKTKSQAAYVQARYNRQNREHTQNKVLEEKELETAKEGVMKTFKKMLRKQLAIQGPKNALIDAQSLQSKQGRINKNIELKKHQATVENLKQNLAKQIVNKSLNIEQFHKLGINDLFKHASLMEAERNRKKAINNRQYQKSDKERQILAERRLEKRVKNHIKASVSNYSSNFELKGDLSEEQADIMRLKSKITDPYSYFQEKQNRVEKAYEMMNVYRTVYKIEKEIKEAQTYLSMTNKYYEKLAGRGSPTQSEYNYIKRLVDDGEPVVLTKKIRKALKIKDETEQLKKAMQEDLQDAGYKQQDILDKDEQNQDMSSDDSADVRKRKAIQTQMKINHARGSSQSSQQMILEKHISKTEKAKIAFKAERERQKILRPKSKDSTSVFGQMNQQKRVQTAQNRRSKLRQQKITSASIKNFNLGEQSLENLTVLQQDFTQQSEQQLAYTQKPILQPSHQKLLVNKKSYHALALKKFQGDSSQTLEGFNKIESTDFATASQKNLAPSSNGYNDDTAMKPNNQYSSQAQKQIEPDFLDISIGQVDELALNADQLRTTTLNQQEQIDLMATHTFGDQNILVTENQPTSQGSLQKITIIKPSEKMQNNSDESSLDVELMGNQSQSAISLEKIKRIHHQTSRSLSNNIINLQQQRPYSSIQQSSFYQQLQKNHASTLEPYEQAFQQHQYHQLKYQNEQKELESSMSQDMLEFVNAYGISVQKAAAPEKIDRHQQRTRSTLLENNPSTATMTSQQLQLNSKRGQSVSAAPSQRNNKQTIVMNHQHQQIEQNFRPFSSNVFSIKTTNYDSSQQKSCQKLYAAANTNFIKTNDRQSNKSKIVQKNEAFSSTRLNKQLKGGNKARALTAHNRQRAFQDRRDRQDLNFDAKQENAENNMKEQKLLLFQKKLEQNMLRSATHSTLHQMSSQEITSQEQAKQSVAYFVHSVDKQRSSDYNTKAIATRLHSIAQKRIKAATFYQQNNKKLYSSLQSTSKEGMQTLTTQPVLQSPMVKRETSYGSIIGGQKLLMHSQNISQYTERTDKSNMVQKGTVWDQYNDPYTQTVNTENNSKPATKTQMQPNNGLESQQYLLESSQSQLDDIVINEPAAKSSGITSQTFKPAPKVAGAAGPSSQTHQIVRNIQIGQKESNDLSRDQTHDFDFGEIPYIKGKRKMQKRPVTSHVQKYKSLAIKNCKLSAADTLQV